MKPRNNRAEESATPYGGVFLIKPNDFIKNEYKKSQQTVEKAPAQPKSFGGRDRVKGNRQG